MTVRLFGQHNTCVCSGSYVLVLLDDPSIEVVYIPLPNGLHLEWALKALSRGKHVLLEKPSVSNAEDAAILFHSPVLAQPNGPVLLEAFHYRFQPAWQYFMSLCDPPNVVYAKSVFKVPAMIFKKDDIRFKYDLAGGALSKPALSSTSVSPAQATYPTGVFCQWAYNTAQYQPR